MLPFNPVWAIAEHAMSQIDAIVAKCNAGIDVARIRIEPEPIAQVLGGTAVIRLEGVMTKNESIFSMLGMGTSTTAVRGALRAAVADKDVRAILLNTDSPGGTVDGQHELVSDIRAAKRQKPVYGYVNGEAASAAYWALSQADAIYAGPGSQAGSIGVKLMAYDFSRMFANAGVEAVPITTGKFKAAGAMGTEITDEHRAYFQSIVDAFFEDFSGDVRRGRKMGEARAKQVFDGRMFVARDAMEFGMVDGLQSFEDTLRMTNRLASRNSTTKAKARARFRAIEACG